MKVSATEHYDRHLGPVYSWIVGGAGNAIERGAAEIKELAVAAGPSAYAVDLGAGFGMHSIPLARSGFEVLAVDACAALLEELQVHRDSLEIERDIELDIEMVEGDLRDFPRYLRRAPQLVFCMGDTLTHLPDEEAAGQLVATVATELADGGRFVISIRDYEKTLTGEQRFIPVRSSDQRIFTCFLEYTESRITVNDILYEKHGSDWEMSVSSYDKLRLRPDWVEATLREQGFSVERQPGAAGMVRFVATGGRGTGSGAL